MIDRFKLWLRDSLRKWLLLDQGMTKQMYWDLRNDVTQLQSDFEKNSRETNDKLRTLDSGLDRLHEEDRRLEELIGSTAEGLQLQITELSSLGSPIADAAKEKDKQPAAPGIIPGHVRFSQRKRNYIQAHAKPALSKNATQIVENERLINSGTRQVDVEKPA